MELFALEHKRLWRTPRVLICVALCFFYCIIYTGFISYQWTYFGTPGDDPTSMYSNKFDGYSSIRSYQAQSDTYGDYWTDDAFQQIVYDFQTMEPPPQLQSMYDWQLVSPYCNNLYPELKDNESQLYQPLIHYVDTTKLTDFYQRRADFLEYNLEVNRQNGLLTEDDKQMLLEMDSHVKTPWRYEWTQGWKYLLSNSLPMMSKIAPYLAIALGFLFSGEWHNSTAPLLHTTKYGWKKLAWTKVFSGLAFAVELYLLIAGGKVLLQLIFLGTKGWDMPIQMVKYLAVAPWNMLQAELFELAFYFLGVIGYGGIVMLMSALVKNNVLSLVLSLAFIYVPDLFAQYLPVWAQNASQFIPLMGYPTDLFQLNVFHIFGKGIWMPYLLITVPVLIGLICLPFAIWGWSRRERA